MTPCTHPHCPHPAAWLHDGAAWCVAHAADRLIRTGRAATVLPSPPADIVDRLAATGDALAAEAAAEIRRLRAAVEAGQSGPLDGSGTVAGGSVARTHGG